MREYRREGRDEADRRECGLIFRNVRGVTSGDLFEVDEIIDRVASGLTTFGFKVSVHEVEVLIGWLLTIITVVF